MGLFKGIGKAVKKTVKKVKKVASKTVGRATKAVVTGGLSEAVKHKTGRKLVGQAAPIVGGVVGTIFGGPAGGGLGAGLGTLFTDKYLKDKTWKQSLGSGLKTGAFVGGGLAAAGGLAALAGGGTVGGMTAGQIGTIAGGKLAGLGGKLLGGIGSKVLGGVLGGGGGAGGGLGLGDLASMYGAYQGYKGSEAAQEDISRYEGSVESNIKRQEELAGLDPIVSAQMKHQASQDLRGAQAERGIFESGVAAKQEAELMPQIDQQQKAWQLQQLAGISGQYSPLMESAGRRAGTYQDMAGGFGQALAGSGGGGGGGFDLAGLAGQAWGGIKGLFGGGGQGYDLEGVGGGSTMTGGLSGIDYSNLSKAAVMPDGFTLPENYQVPKGKPAQDGGTLQDRLWAAGLEKSRKQQTSMQRAGILGDDQELSYVGSVAESGQAGMDWLKQQGYEVE